MTETTPLLGPFQRKLVGFALSLVAFLAIVVLLVGLLVRLSLTLGYFSSVLWPLAVAGIVALMLRPVVELIERRLRVQRLTAVVLLFAAFVLTLAAVALAITPVLISQAVDFAHTVPALWDQVSTYTQTHYPEWIAYSREQLNNPTVKGYVDEAVAQGRELIASLLPGVKAAFGQIRNVFGFFVGLAVVPIYLFFLLLSQTDVIARLHGLLPFLRDDLREDLVFLVQEFVGIVVAFFRGQLLIGLIMGVAYATGFTVGGLKFGMVIGLAMGLLNIVPYLGTILGLTVALPLAFFQPGGGLWLVGIVLAVFAAVQAGEAWFLTPRIMGRQTGLHPMAIIFSVLFWGAALDGVLGMVLAIPLSAFVVTAWRLVKHKYLPVPAARP